MGAIQERNRLIDDAIVNLKGCHDRYFPVGKSLSDAEWEEAIAAMDDIARLYKDTNIADLAWKLNQAFLDDIEVVHYMWLAKGK